MNTRRRNPSLFGRTGGKDMLTMIGGGLVGVTVTKMLPTYLPSSITSMLPAGGFTAVIVSAASAWIAGWAAGKVNKEFGDAVLFGGLMQAGSVALNAFIPSVGSTFSLGDLIAGNYVVPQNPIRAAMSMPVAMPAARGNTGMGAAAFPRPF
jgi:hypothetical protein